jgi:phage terminase large subunit GpA-like protein
VALADAYSLVWEAASGAIRPDPLLTVSEWADKHRFLSQRASAEPGAWRTDRTPYLREVMDCLSATSPVEKAVFMKGAQVGGTEAGNNWLGYVIDNCPGPMLMVQPTVEMAKRNSKTRIAPLIEESPSLREKVRDPRSRDSGNSLLAKEFPGGVVVMAGANSAAGLRSMPVRFLFLDEPDAYPGDVDGEGDPCTLAEARTRTFSRRKVFYVSTPTLAGRSRIEREFLESDMRFFEVPCPLCGSYQQLVWEQMKWEEGRPETARYQCAHCDEQFEEHHKNKILPRGQWVPQNPEGKWRGYHISSLYSPLGWFSWKECVEAFTQARKTDEAMRVFQNTILGLTYADTGEAPDWELLYGRRENYPIGQVPDPVVFLTAGVDVQKDRIELEVVGWGRNLESWSIDYAVLHGDTASDEVWEQLSAVVRQDYGRMDGMRLPIRMAAVDTGFRTQEVYRWVKSQSALRVMAVKGREQQATIISQPSTVEVTIRGKRIRGGIKVWPVGVSVAKSELYGWLRRRLPSNLEEGLPYGWCHFPQHTEEYFKQLTAESLVSRIVRGYQKYQWEKTRDRNEALDCRVYNRAAAMAIGADRWDDKRWEYEAGQSFNGMATVSAQTAQVSQQSPIKRRKSTFL